MPSPYVNGPDPLRIQIPPKRIPRKPVGPNPIAKQRSNPASASSSPCDYPPSPAATLPVSGSSTPCSTTTFVNDIDRLKLGYIDESPNPLRHTSTALTGTTLASEGSAQPPSSIEAAEDAHVSSKWAKAWEETKYFAGGLINHPTESTKHYSVLRHSHGIVPYQGHATSVAISIFADRPLPLDRKLWLQQKGWTGKTGWKAKQLFGANGGWLDVTPSVEALPEQLPKSSERAWQRDCKKFWEREASKKGHVLRETCVVRIPCEAEDGYFRIVVCGDGKMKNKLCPSPIFRVLSVSGAPGSIKGASLSTLPLELGIKALTTVANNAIFSAAQPAINTVQSKIGQYVPDFWQQQVASVAYASSGLEATVDDVSTRYQDVRDTSYQHVDGVDERVYDALDSAPMFGPADGPRAPYPIQMSSVIIPGTGNYVSSGSGTPTANLKFVREEVTMSLNGLYFGWARVSPAKTASMAARDCGLEESFSIWHPAIIKICVAHGVPFTVTYGAAKTVSAYIIHEFRNVNMANSKIELVAMGFLRHIVDPNLLGENSKEKLEQDSDNRIADIAITEASLSRPAWSIEAVYGRRELKMQEEVGQGGRAKRLSLSMTDRYIDARQAAQRQIDRVPVHRLGIRRNVDILKEQVLGTGGVFVRR